MKPSNWFDNQPIQNKLVLINALVIGMALIPIVAMMFGYEFYAVRQDVVQEIRVQANIVSDNAAAAAAFKDAMTASEALATLRASPDVLRASLSLPDGTVLATYHRKDIALIQRGRIGVLQSTTEELTWSRFRLSKSVYLHTQFVGTLSLEASLDLFYRRVFIYFAVILLTTAIGLGLAFLLAVRLKQSITQPLSQLLDIVHRVTHEQDFSVRPEAERADEIGELSRAFGGMMSNLQERDENLQEKVAERTRELSASNDQLRIEIGERKQAELKLEESRIQLRGLIAHREDIREEERKHIAREVHDELGQILSGLKLNIDILNSHYAGDSKPLRKYLQETMTLVGKAIDTVRNIASSLRPIELDMGIVYALNILVRRFGTYTGIQCKVHVSDPDFCLEENHAISLYRIAQEALTNVAKHAKASEVSISLKMEGDSYVLKVRDNGRGFDINEYKANSFGLLGIRERVNMLGGTATVNSSSGAGTEIVVRIPVVPILEEL